MSLRISDHTRHRAQAQTAAFAATLCARVIPRALPYPNRPPIKEILGKILGLSAFAGGSASWRYCFHAKARARDKFARQFTPSQSCLPTIWTW